MTLRLRRGTVKAVDAAVLSAAHMTPATFKSIRQRAGLSTAQLAARLRIEDARTIRRYEAGERAISGPVSLLMEQLAETLE